MTVPSGTKGSMTVTMQSTGLSELSPRIQVYNSSLTSLDYATAPNTYGATVGVTLSGVSPGQVYYFRASAAGSGPTGAGNFGLLVNFGATAQYPIGPPNTYLANQADQGGGVTPLSLPGLTGDLLQIGSLVGIGDSLTIAPDGDAPGGPGRPASSDGLGHADAGHTAFDQGLLIAPAPDVQARDAALNSLFDDRRGRPAGRAAWLPSILALP